MNYETYNDHDILIVDIDGKHSDPITPLSPKAQAEFDRRREAYIKAGLVKDLAPKNDQSKLEHKEENQEKPQSGAP